MLTCSLPTQMGVNVNPYHPHPPCARTPNLSSILPCTCTCIYKNILTGVTVNLNPIQSHPGKEPLVLSEDVSREVRHPVGLSPRLNLEGKWRIKLSTGTYLPLLPDYGHSVSRRLSFPSSHCPAMPSKCEAK